jgi:hypothetical protein
MIFIGKDKPSKVYGKVWNVDKKEKYTDITISTGDKQQDGTWKNSSWRCRLVGQAKDVEVNQGDKVIITSAKIENIWDKDNKKEWLKLIVFDIEVEGVELPEWKDVEEVSDESTEDLPF